jgi:hypothetical protein
LRSAQRFFIANDNRLLPSGVSPPRFLAFNADGRDVAMLVFLAVRGEFAPSNAAMARLSLSLSRFKSATIFCKSKLHSFLLICQLNVACYFVLPQHFSRMSVGIAGSPAHAGISLISPEIAVNRRLDSNCRYRFLNNRSATFERDLPLVRGERHRD